MVVVGGEKGVKEEEASGKGKFSSQAAACKRCSFPNQTTWDAETKRTKVLGQF